MHNKLTNSKCVDENSLIISQSVKYQKTISKHISEKVNLDDLIQNLLQSKNYISKIISSSLDYLKKEFIEQDLISFLINILFLKSETDIYKTIHCFSAEYIIL